MKCCSKCGVEKPFSEYSKDKTRPDGLQYVCKSCKKEEDKQRYLDNPEPYKQQSKQWYLDNLEHHKQSSKQQRLSKILPYYIVYLLPEENYVGKTNNPYYRMCNHRLLGRNTSGWVELHRFDSEKEALAKEAEYHLAGYEGIQNPHKNKYDGK